MRITNALMEKRSAAMAIIMARRRVFPWHRWLFPLCLLVLCMYNIPSGASAASKTSFRYRTYGQMATYLQDLTAKYPELVQMFVAQEKYNLSYPEELTCVEDDASGEKVPCKQFVVHLTNHSTLPDPSRPEVFLSGALHGNERVGPITTIELIAVVAKFATAYANNMNNSSKEEVDPITVNTQRWFYELVNTRSIYITPMTNAFGYAHNRREELGVDPNRDYNYLRAPQDCMLTMTSRAVNELWRDHIFQMAITFHGGTRAVSYEWGSPDHYFHGDSHRSEKSPDHMAQFQLANTFATFAGAFADGELYPTGTMNDIVYGVSGGMEDWAYAASWENHYVYLDDDAQKPFHPCKPNTYGGYPEEKTIYNNITHRAFNMLVETSYRKEPAEDDLGYFEDLHNAEIDFFQQDAGLQVGHVTRNVRLALMMIEMVQPYIRWVHAIIPPSPPLDSVISAFPQANLYVSDASQLNALGCSASTSENVQVTSCDSTECIIQHQTEVAQKLQVAWEVLGALTVDSTYVQVSSTPNFEKKNILFKTRVQQGYTRRFFDFSSRRMQGSREKTDTMGTSLFVSCLNLNESYPQEIYVRAVATVDQDWAEQGSGDDAPSPRIPPQSHMVNARTNPNWDMEWNDHRVKGTRIWHSPVITVKSEYINAPKSSASSSTGTNESQDAGSLALPTITLNSLTPLPSIEELSSEASDSDDNDEDEDEDEDSSEEIEEDLDQTVSSASGSDTYMNAPSFDTATSSSGSSIEQQSLLSQPTKDSDKTNYLLLNYGYLVLGLGGLVILLTLTFLYRRVFRSKHQTYVNINRQFENVDHEEQ